MDNRQICGTCKYHQHEDIDDGWVCACPESDNFTDLTDYECSCDEWEARR